MNKISPYFFLVFLIIFSFSINFYYGSRGVLAVDTFSHFDSTYKLLNGIIPFRDFWVISGGIIDYLQLPFFYFFGVNWTSYLAQSSFFNCCLTIATFFFLKKIELDNVNSFLYSFCFSVLANPSMGTPFIDHYSAFFSLLGLYCFYGAIQNNNFFLWFLLPILFFLAFFSKQTPASYIIISISLMIFFYIVVFKKIKVLIPLIVSTIFCFSFLVGFLMLNEIKFSNFIVQYFLFPQTIGAERFSEYKLNFNNIILDFKFIHLFLIFLVYQIFKDLKMKTYQEKKFFIINFTLLFFSLSLIFHQIYTKNFIYIFFLIPIIGGVLHSQSIGNFKNKKFVMIFLIFFTVFSTIKYHQRFNVERKMLNLEGKNLSLSIDAAKIDKKLSGLKWITHGNLEPQEEIDLIIESLNIINNDNDKILLLTHYNFFSSVLERKLYSPSRWPTDLVSNPDENNEYFENYLEFTKSLIVEKNIKSIYITLPSYHDNVQRIFGKNCLIKTKKNKILLHYKINDDCI